MRAFWFALLATFACAGLVVLDPNGRGVFAAVPLAWFAGLLLSFALFSDGDA